MSASPDILTILMADDDMDDRMLFSDALSRLKLNVELQTVKDGVELMDYLQNSVLIIPEILFLDLNMPRKNGFECLEEIKKHPVLKDIFVIIYSTSEESKDVEHTFQLGANLFVKKPDSYTGLKAMLQKILTMDVKRDLASVTREQFMFRVEY